MSFLTLDNISYHYLFKKSYTKALDNISFSVKEGEFITLLGPSNCGKSTVLSIIAGIIKQTTGEVLFRQQLLSNSNLTVGYMPREDYLFPWKTIKENVLIGPKITTNKTIEIKEKALRLLDEVGLTNAVNDYPSSLSGGMRQRVALVRTLITDPQILLLDEPFSTLDYQMKLKLEDIMSNILQMYKKTTILVTHDIGEAIALSDRIILMDANPGTIVKTFEVPLELRNEMPFLVQWHPKYRVLFDKIWEQLNENEFTTSKTKVVEPHNES